MGPLTDVPGSRPTVAGSGEDNAVAAYKTIFKAVLDRRPSGMRLKLARVLGKNRSFISQIASPTYQIPIPAQHLATIFEVCHFSAAEKGAFLEAYDRAHPRRAGRRGSVPRERTVALRLPDLGSPTRNGQLEALLQDFAHRLFVLLREDTEAP